MTDTPDLSKDAGADTAAAAGRPGTAQRNQFGAFGGVFTPSILTILGAIMFMRAGFVTAQAGVIQALAILAVANGITFLTGLSISAISTNTRMRGGGSYFLISRTLGPEFGGAIGLTMYLAQALSVPFYLLAFVEALTRTFPALQPYFLNLSLGTAVAVWLLVCVGAAWTIRVQYLILTVLGLSIVAFLGGAATHFSPATFTANLQPTWSVGSLSQYAGRYGFWVLLAIYFPAVTGIDAGLNMSGDLREPARAIPRGTLAAIGVGFLIYAAQIVMLGGAQTRDAALLSEPSQPYRLMVENALYGAGFLVVAGVFAATLSSALGSLLGGPRILQALARDRIVGVLQTFAKGSRRGDEPRRATLLTFAICVGVLAAAGNGEGGTALNLIAQVVTMFFLYAYGIVNLAAFVESFGANPSFRPTFKYFHWLPALIGALGCAAAAFLISPGAAVFSMALIGLFYWRVRRRVFGNSFSDARRGFLYARVRNNLLALTDLPEHARNWRPTVLAFSGNPKAREALVQYAVWLSAGRGIVTLAEVLVGEFDKLSGLRKAAEERLEKFIRESRIPAFPEVVVLPDFGPALCGFLQSHSIGPIKPTLTMFGWPGETVRVDQVMGALRTAQALDMSVVLLHGEALPELDVGARIDVWWRGERNGELMLLLAHLLTTKWAGARLRILRAVREEAGRAPATAALLELTATARIDADVEVVVSGEPFESILRRYSGDAAVAILGFNVPAAEETEPFHARMSQVLRAVPAALLVSAAGRTGLME